MTEAQWLEGVEPPEMWEYASSINGDRKLRLLAVALCRRLRGFLNDPRSWAAVELAERYADGSADEGDRVKARLAASRVEAVINGGYPAVYFPAQAASDVVGVTSNLDDCFKNVYTLLSIASQSDACREVGVLLRDIFGNPFRPVTFPPEWLTSTVLSLATQMYASRDFSAMPILADALQDAGCDNDDVLNHCRGEAPHVRGCWVVDLLLGKE